MKKDVVNFLFKVFKTFFTYALLLYFLEMENFINCGWSFYTILFFLIPFGVIILPLKFYFILKKRSEKV